MATPFLGNIMHNPPPPLILSTLPATLTMAEAGELLKRMAGGEQLLDEAEELLEEFTALAHPAAVLRPLRVVEINDAVVTLHAPDDQHTGQLAMGWAAGFLAQAQWVVAGGYTIGRGVQEAAALASQRHDYLKAFLLEQLGLALLGKTGRALNEKIEAIAAARGWGVGPLLSPGSVHGWELGDQSNLCRLLPLAEIDMACSPAGVLSPFNALSIIVGLGPGYDNPRIASPCTVCNNRQNCHLRRETP